jgi:hypothetical protein
MLRRNLVRGWPLNSGCDWQQLGNTESESREGVGASRAISYSKSLEATPRIELGMEVLQTSALPLGYVAAPFVARFYRRRRPAQDGAPLR